MSKFHGFRECVTCDIACTPMNFVDVEGKRHCIACWTEAHNPDHPDLNALREKCIEDAETWKCIKWTREEGPLPNGPQPSRRD